jgi:hypothetical protein
MLAWTPEQVFMLTYLAAALSGLAALLRSDEPITVRSVSAAILFYGAAGTGLGMMAYEWLGGKQNPWRVVGAGMLVGIRIIKLSDIAHIIRKIIGPDDQEK